MPDREDRLNRAIDALLAGAPPEEQGSELKSLIRIAATLRGMPEEGFQSRLREQLQWRSQMTQTKTAAVREGFRTVTPYISIPEGGRFIDFLKHVFGAKETLREPSPAGFHSEVQIGNSMLMVESAESTRIGAFHIYVPDCDAAYRRAIEAGAESTGEPADRPYGERSGFVKDFVGNHWYIATRFPSHPPAEGLGTVQPFLFPAKVRPFIDFVKRAFGAAEMAVFEAGGRVMHAAVRIGDAVLEMGEPEGEALSLPCRFFLLVDDCDAWHARAVEAGATTVAPPTDQADRARSALIADPFGFEWLLHRRPQ
jgi:uncharacterized glyoxalase superfamily protein PhnB